MEIVLRNKRIGTGTVWVLAVAVALLTWLLLSTVAVGLSNTWTSDSDFDQGTLQGVNHDAPNSNQLQLSEESTTFPVLWVANAAEDTVSKIDTNTTTGGAPGKEVARYRTWFGPKGTHGAWDGPAPSRTAVDSAGNVYVANRMFYGHLPPMVMKILNTGCDDRNSNGNCETSSDANADGIIVDSEMAPPMTDSNANNVIDTAELTDERIVWSVPVGQPGAVGRSLCIGTDGTVWVGTFNQTNEGGQWGYWYYGLDPATGAVTDGPFNSGRQNYGCAVDSTGTLWSASLSTSVQELDTSSGIASGPHFGPHQNYGIAAGNSRVYLSDMQGGAYMEFDPSSNTFTNPADCDNSTSGQQWCGFSSTGVGVDGSGDIVANNWGNGWMYKFQTDGTIIWSTPSGVGGDLRGAVVDSAGDVWMVHRDANRASKWDGASGAYVGSIPVGNQPYTYSDATGIGAASQANKTGYWTIEYNSSNPGQEWGTATWNTETPVGGAPHVPSGATLTVEVRAAETQGGLEFQSFTTVSNGVEFTDITGQWIEIKVTFEANDLDESPILTDLTIDTRIVNEPPDCSNATASQSTIWPPNHKMVDITVVGVTDPDGDPVTITVDSIYQDEPVDTTGDGKFSPDGKGVGTDTAEVRAERTGSKKVPGNGRVYHIGYSATDGNGGSCPTGQEVLVGVPHDQGKGSTPVDDGPLYDSTVYVPGTKDK